MYVLYIQGKGESYFTSELTPINIHTGNIKLMGINLENNISSYFEDKNIEIIIYGLALQSLKFHFRYTRINNKLILIIPQQEYRDIDIYPQNFLGIRLISEDKDIELNSGWNMLIEIL